MRTSSLTCATLQIRPTIIEVQQQASTGQIQHVQDRWANQGQGSLSLNPSHYLTLGFILPDKKHLRTGKVSLNHIFSSSHVLLSVTLKRKESGAFMPPQHNIN